MVFRIEILNLNYFRDEVYICFYVKLFWNYDFMYLDKGGYVYYDREILNNRSLYIIEVYFLLIY